MPDKHALLGPSNSNIWFRCGPALRLGEQFEDRGSVYAAEGTLAHSYCELLLRKLNGEDGYADANLPDDMDAEMRSHVLAYRDFVEEELNAARAVCPTTHLFVEVQFDLSEYIPEGFGTSDAVIVSDECLTVIDFKYGKGVAVNAVNNSQLRLYALGAYTKFGSLYDFNRVRTVVFQPRVQNIGDDELTVQELLDWAIDEVKPLAERAWKGEGEFVVGDHCRFCRASGVCRARAEEAFKVIEKTDTKPPLLGDDEIPAILDKLDNTEKWIAAVRAYATARAINDGQRWEGYKLVESRTQRRINDQLGALTALNKAGFSTEDVTNVKLKGLTDLEHLLGKKQFAEVLGPYTVKPAGAPCLAKASDKRPEINPAESIFN